MIRSGLSGDSKDMKDMYVDLGAEQLLAAEKDTRKIAVEVKSLIGLSEMDDLEKAIGQYVVYYNVLRQVEPERDLYLNRTTEDSYTPVRTTPDSLRLWEYPNSNGL